METFKLNLRENAVDSLEEGLVKYENGRNGDDREFKFCILNISHFIELSFKLFITNINPILIYKNPYSENLNKEITITMWEAVNLYKNTKSLTQTLTKENQDQLEWLRDIRNKIEHHEFSIDSTKVEADMSQILKFMDNLYRAENEVEELRKRLTPESRALYDELVNHYEKQLTLAIKKANETAETLTRATPAEPFPDLSYDDVLRKCPECNNPTLSYGVKKNGYYFCFFCESTYKAENCLQCNMLFPNCETDPTDTLYSCSDSCMGILLHRDRDD
ncbi:MAG TPA: hypothetical protein VGV92_01695 [Gammaproteobacteria bacterium]|nr:hypothetical protein [Gammaproteobacteria bacterium]